MFTGIIEEKGTVLDIYKTSVAARIKVAGNRIFSDLKIGDSVAVNGVCLTAAEISEETFTADVMNETFSRSSLAELKKGSHVNLERAMSAGGRFGGHIVAGHVDGTGKIRGIEKDDNAVRYEIEAAQEILRYIVEKGSVAIDGISLTVTEVDSDSFSVSVIPHTAKETVLSEKNIGDRVNLENDIIGKYVERLMGFRQEKKENYNKSDDITMDFLAENGYL